MSTWRDAALDDLVRERGAALVRYGYLLTGDTALAQDLVQDAIVKVFVRAHRGAPLESLEAYVRRTMVTLSIDGFRRRTRSSSLARLAADPEVRPDPVAGAAERMDVHAALAELGRQERTAVVLRYFDDLTVPEVAARMGLAEGSVKRYLSNALRRLEGRLGPIAVPAVDEVVGVARPERSR